MNLTVIIAFVANVLIAVAKTAAAFVTGSASMVAEAAHSWADSGNEIFLMIADKRSKKPRDAAHPLGHGREAYVWSMFAALGLFAAGSAVSITHGVQQLINPTPADNFAVAYVVFAIAFVLEGTSFLQALHRMRRDARAQERDVIEQALETSDPTLRGVFAEDLVAVLGILVAAVGVVAHQLTGNPVPDAIGSIAVGVLLGFVAIVLVDRNRRFLVGVEGSPRVRAAALEHLLALPDVAKVSYLHLEYVGPRQVYLVASVDLVGDDTESHVAIRLRAIERELEALPSIIEAVLTVSEPSAAPLPGSPVRS